MARRHKEMNLSKYQGKNIKIFTIDGQKISGRVIAFTDENEWDEPDPTGDSISVENNNGINSIYEK